MPEIGEAMLLAGERDECAGELDIVTARIHELAEVEVVGEQIFQRAESADRLERRPLDCDRRAQRIVHRLDNLGEPYLPQYGCVDVERIEEQVAGTSQPSV